MKTKIILLEVLLFTSITGISQTKSKFDSELNTIVKMFKTRDIDIIDPILAENYVIAGIFPGAEEQVLPQVIPQLPRFDSYKLISEANEKEGTTRVKVLFIEKSTGIDYPADFLFNKNKKIQEFNILEKAKIETQINR